MVEGIAAAHSLSVIQLPVPASIVDGQPVTDQTSRRAPIEPISAAIHPNISPEPRDCCFMRLRNSLLASSALLTDAFTAGHHRSPVAWGLGTTK
jgi:hypothetical protein